MFKNICNCINYILFIIYISNNLTSDYYKSKKEIINKNWNLALDYVHYEQNIINTITNIFKHTKLI